MTEIQANGNPVIPTHVLDAVASERRNVVTKTPNKATPNVTPANRR